MSLAIVVGAMARAIEWSSEELTRSSVSQFPDSVLGSSGCRLALKSYKREDQFTIDRAVGSRIDLGRGAFRVSALQ